MANPNSEDRPDFRYSEKDYAGEFNILRHEREIIVLALRATRFIERAAAVTKLYSSRQIKRKIKWHGIKKEEWKGRPMKLVQRKAAA